MFPETNGRLSFVRAASSIFFSLSCVVSLENHTKKEKRRGEKRASWKRRNEKSNACTLSFYIGCFGDSLWPPNTVSQKRSIWC